MAIHIKVAGDLHIGQQIDRQYVKTQNVYSTLGKAERTIVHPDELKTPFVMERLNRLKKAGYLDDMYQPVNKKCPWTIAAVIAKEIGEKAEITNFYVLFGKFWNHTTLANDYQGLLNNNKHFKEVTENIRDIVA